MKKATGKAGYKGKERRTGLWAVFLIVSFQILGWIFFSMATPGPVEAKAFTVNSTLDETDTTPGDGVCLSASGFCTLRAAIQEANALAGPDLIKLQTGLYMLTIAGISENDCATGDLDITDDLTITGKGAKNTFINGGKLDRVFHIRGSVSVTIADMTIQNALATEDGYGDVNNPRGGGILNESASTLALKGITLSNNTAAGGVNTSGGGIYNLGMLEITKSTMFNNAAIRGSFGIAGGAIYNYSGTLTITGSTISNNTVSGGKDSWGYGGAILNSGVGILTIKGSTISNNTISVDRMAQGGGIANNGTLTITQSTISNNTAIGSSGQGGGVITSGGGQQQVTITKSIISNNVARGYWAEGGGICGFGDDNEIIITGSTLSYNAASGGIPLPGESTDGLGGGIYVDGGTLTVQNASKVVSNFSSGEGGGIINEGSATVSISADSTVSKNIPDDIWP